MEISKVPAEHIDEFLFTCIHEGSKPDIFKKYCDLVLKTEEEPWSIMERTINAGFHPSFFDSALQQYPFVEKFEPEELKPNVTAAATEFLHKHKHLANVLKKVVKSTMSELDSKGISYSSRIGVAKDIEAPEWEAIKIEVKVDNRSYSEILDMWVEISKEINKMLSKKEAREIYLIMDRG